MVGGGTGTGSSAICTGLTTGTTSAIFCGGFSTGRLATLSTWMALVVDAGGFISSTSRGAFTAGVGGRSFNSVIGVSSW